VALEGGLGHPRREMAGDGGLWSERQARSPTASFGELRAAAKKWEPGDPGWTQYMSRLVLHHQADARLGTFDQDRSHSGLEGRTR
jgi:hypothetical protein